jgi:hypothetical protein
VPRRPSRHSDPDLVDDLTWLRKDKGLTLERLAQAGGVVHACGGVETPIETLHERFLAALRSMHDTDGGRALWAAYGAEEEGSRLLKDRRAAYAASVGRAPDTLKDWEDQALHELALRLLSSYYAGAPTPDQLPIPHGGYLMRRLNVVCLIQDRRFVESRQERTVIPLVDGAPHFVYGTYSPTTLHDVEGGTLGLSKRTPGGTLHRIDFDPPLRRGQHYTFSFRERVPDTDPEPDFDEDFSGQSFESPALRYRVEVHFLGEQPAVVWGYDKLSRIERPGEPEDGLPEKLQVADGPDGVSSCTAEFADLYGGLCAGVAWRWSPKSRPMLRENKK